MKNIDEIGVGVIGSGRWGQNHVRQFATLAGSRLVEVCDLSADRLADVRAKYPGTETTDDLNVFLSRDDIEAVVIASPAPLHYAQAKAALEAGKHVLVEKPITLDPAEAEELIRIADESELILMVGHLLLYHQAVQTIKKLIEADDIGDIYYMYSQRLNLGVVRRDENCLWSLAPHDISVILYLLDKVPIRVSATGQCYLRDGVEDVVFSTLTFSDNKVAHLQISWLDPHKVRKFTIVGTEKMIVFDDMEASEKIRIYDKGVSINPEFQSYGEDLTLRFGDIMIPSLKVKEPLAVECAHFLESVRKKERPLTDGMNGLNVLKVLSAAQKSLDNGGVPVDIDG